MTENFNLRVNGVERQVTAEADTPLLYILRNDLKLKGTRFGCGEGNCGACTVLVDGHAVPSCDTPLWSAPGHDIMTIEGLARTAPEDLHPIQQAFLDEQAAQCGYCSNGIIMSAKALLDATPDPDDAQIATALQRNLCRCGTHVRVLRAIRRASRVMRGKESASAAGPPQGARPLGGAARSDARGEYTNTALAFPASLKMTPRLDRWIRFDADQSVTVYSGKVELGQGIETAIAQIAAEELDVALERVRLVAGDTTRTPNELYTSGSMSIEVGGASMRIVCAEVRGLFVDAAARLFEVSADDVRVNDGALEVPGTDLRTSYWKLSAQVDLARDATGTAKLKLPAEYQSVGTSVPRRDLRAKLTGAAYVHDMELPGMVHGRICRPPAYSARLESFDAAPVRAIAGVLSVLVSGNFIGVTAEREEQALQALAAARAAAQWEQSADRAALPSSTEIRQFLPGLPSERTVVHEKNAAAATVTTIAQRLEAAYSKPYIAHGSIGPSCALACFAGDSLTVWTHAQGSHLLRDQIAVAMGMPAADVDVIHADGAGCYGHNGADDAALDAALLARDCGRPVLLQWTRDDEFAWSPFGSAMVVRMTAGLDAGGTVVDWQHEIWSHTHVKRPGWADGINLLAAWHIEPPHPVPPARDNALPAGGGDRNAVPLYDFARQQVLYNFIEEMPLRVSALRTLGAYGNVFAIESFIDELAAAAGADPVEFRLRHLRDERAREVIAAAARLAGWQAGEGSDGTRGRGIGFARYKNMSAYLAVVAEIDVREKIRVSRVFAAVDCGLVVNPDGVRNQIEGGIIQAISWTLSEAVTWDSERVTSRSWDSYPILRFDGGVPAIQIVLLDRPDSPSLGVGECAAGPTGAALANALQHALGVRVRDLPLTAERIAQAIG